MRTFLTAFAVRAALLLAWAVFFPVFASDGVRAVDTGCLHHLKQMGLGLVQYSEDQDGRLPSRDAWADAIVPYTKNPDLFYDPILAKDGRRGPYAYAFNGALTCAKVLDQSMRTPMVYDSVNPTWNASDLVASLPNPGRHRGKDNVAFADSHAKAVTTP